MIKRLRAWAAALKRDVAALWIAARDPRVSFGDPYHALISQCLYRGMRTRFSGASIIGNAGALGSQSQGGSSARNPPASQTGGGSRFLTRRPRRQLAANFRSLMASKSCTPPPTRLVV